MHAPLLCVCVQITSIFDMCDIPDLSRLDGRRIPNSTLLIIGQGWLNLLKVVGAHLTSKTNFYGKKLNSYEQLIKVVGAHAPSAPLVPPPM